MWVFWVLFGLAAIVLVLRMVKVERARLDTHVTRCEAAAKRIGAGFEPRASEGLIAKISGFDLTYADGAMLPQRVRDVFRRRSAHADLQVFLHEYRSASPEGGGGARRSTVGCFVSPSLHLPPFRLSPERTIERIAARAGMRDIDFDTHPGFSASYFLNAQDDAAARALFRREVLDYFERHPELHVEGNGDTLLLYRLGHTLEPEELSAFFETLEELAQLFSGKLH
jgi:hypothetical protein